MSVLTAIIRNITTEKSSNAQAIKQYTFAVKRTATKIDIKKAIEEIYGVEVKNVRVMVTPKKTRLIGKGKLWTKRPVAKKAIVTLKNGKTLDPSKIGKNPTKPKKVVKK